MVQLRGEIFEVEVIAVGDAIREVRRLEKVHGAGRWRKLKGVAMVELPDGEVAWAEVHWYEAHGRGRRELKIKRLVESR
ncbi:MAG TPA: hypothetical protein VHM02_11625 [Thermoanaerobaculia bacterium]|nr:hypothetical protein [Thermoanaerobaculia bacterium]